MKKFYLLLIVLMLNVFIQSPSFAIKVGLLTEVDKFGVGANVSAVIVDANTNHSVCSLDAMKGYEIKAYGNKIAIKYNGMYYKIDSDNVVVKVDKDGFICVKNKWYRGIIMIQNKNGRLTVINNVNIEDYIKGVVPAEMPAGWETEALKAQAIAARSYALANLGKRAKYGYDLNDTTEDQVYGGATSETNKTNKVVEDTKGLVLIYNSKIIPAYYSASAGGQTVNASTAWGKDLPFIRSVPSFDDDIKKNGHGIGMSQHGANNLAKQGYNAYQILQYFYNDVKFARINPEYFK